MRSIYPRAPRVPQGQLDGMETSVTATMAARAQLDRERKSEEKKKWELLYDFHMRSHKLPGVYKFKLLKSEQTPRKDGKAIPNKWEFDFAFESHQIIVEIDGGIWRPGGGAHSHPIDITRNMTKRNDASLAGFFVLQFTPQEVKSGHAIKVTQQMLYARGWRP